MMINSISGRITHRGTASLHLELNGIEWDLQVPTSSLRELPATGEEARVYTYLHHRDDALALFGFATPEERSVFLDLLKVGGIGPRQAVKILSGLTVEELVRSLDNDDVDGLSRVPGLGKKTAQKIILTLRGRLTIQEESTAERYEDIVQALADMGFDRQSASSAVEKTSRAVIGEDLADEEREKEIFRRAIVALSSSQ